ncbi:MAG TPA: MFS transporter [Candidatus Acidoferrum sp.]|nr:MFS transporter [Candidatus Acidoferrum sp.]
MKRDLSPYWTLFILTGLNLFNYLDRFVLSVVLSPLRQELKIDYEQAGTVGTAFMLGYFITSPLFGYLGDRASRKWLIAGGIFVWSLGTVLTGFAHSYGELLFYRVLVGVGEASYATISPSIIADKFSGTKRNTALTIFYVAIPVGAALGNFLGGQIAAHASWREAFIWAGAPGLVLALVMLPFNDPKRTEAGKPGTAKPGARDMLRLLVTPSYALVVLGYTAYTFALGGFQHWGATFLQEVHGLDVEYAGNFFGISLAVSGLVGTGLGGFLASALQRRTSSGYAIVLGCSVAAAVPVAFAAFRAGTPSAAMALLATAMFLLFLSTGPTNTLILETAPANLRASAMAVSIFTIHLLGDLWSPAIIGRAAKTTSLDKAMMILPIALLVAAALWLTLAMRQRRAKPGS